MRPVSTDPDIRRYDPRHENVVCSECHASMLPLKDFEIQTSSESPSIDGDDFDFTWWGIGNGICNYIFGWFAFAWRKVKLARRKRQVLPLFPDSWVCPRCLHVKQLC